MGRSSWLVGWKQRSWMEATKVIHLFAKLRPSPGRLVQNRESKCRWAILWSRSSVILVPARPKLNYVRLYCNKTSNRNYFFKSCFSINSWGFFP